MLCAVLHVSLWLGELLPGQQCINHGFYRVAGCDSLLPAPQISHVVLQEKDRHSPLIWAGCEYVLEKGITCLKVRTGSLPLSLQIKSVPLDFN